MQYGEFERFIVGILCFIFGSLLLVLATHPGNLALVIPGSILLWLSVSILVDDITIERYKEQLKLMELQKRLEELDRRDEK